MLSLALLPLLLEPSASFALIATNNRSLELHRPDLRYADDDGVKYAELFAETGADVTLLTELDFESQRLYPAWIDRAQAPTLEHVFASVDRIALAARAARAKKEDRVDVHIVLAGHGDLDRGQGYLELSGARLTANDLEERILRPLEGAGVDRIHLILDSCNSYFMLNPRKPGGKRFASGTTDARDLFARHPNVGAIVSTSAEAVTYEWSELQSGIFSYEVRSGLRGAADADADGRVTYLELAAFLYTANRAIPNELYRPKVFAHAPSGREEEAVFSAPTGVLARSLRLSSGTERRLTIRDALGVRVLDVHKDAAADLVLRLPASGGELGVYELVPGGVRPVIAFRSITSTMTAEIDLDRTPPAAPQLGARGEAPVFEKLFADPFGPSSIAEYRAHASRNAQVFGVSSADAERLETYLGATASSLRTDRRVVGTGAIGAGGTLAILGGLSLEETKPQAIVLLGAGAVVSAGGAVLIALPSRVEELRGRLAETAGDDRARAVVAIEGELEALAREDRTVRDVAGWTGVIAGSALGAMTAVSIAGARDGASATQVAVLPLSLLVLVTGAEILLTPSPVEELLERYAEHGDQPRIVLAPIVDRDRAGEISVGVGVAGAF